MAIVWAQFADDPGLSGYRKLKGHADRTEQWPIWREKALAFLKGHLAKEKAAAEKSRWRGFPERVSSELVEICLWERDAEAAWRQAKDDGCSDELWLKLASAREAKHPDDALSVYQARIAPTLYIKSNDAYRQGVEFLRKIHGLMARLGREAEFARYLDSVRAAHKLKRNFIRLLDHARLKS